MYDKTKKKSFTMGVSFIFAKNKTFSNWLIANMNWLFLSPTYLILAWFSYDKPLQHTKELDIPSLKMLGHTSKFYK